MAKGQLRGNREAKKPKQVKVKAAAPTSDLTAKLSATQSKPAGKKK